MKIENKPVVSKRQNFGVLCMHLGKMKVGQSIVVPELNSNHRVGISALQYALGYRYRTQKERGGCVRVGRIK